MDEELLYKIALTRIPQVGSVMARMLVSYCGGVEAVFRASLRELCQIPNVAEATARRIRDTTALVEAEAEVEWLSRHPDINPIFYLDPAYPRRLRPLPTAPVLLYQRGGVSLDHPRTVAIVGTRTPTDYGLQMAEELVAGLLPYQPLIISGLAYGVDVTAHRKALEVGLPTLAVLGHGLRKVYPATHRSVAKRMCEQGGGILTEYNSWQEPEREHFPMRNRIVAGLADAVIVVESAASGGSIITTQFANSYNKDVFAVPGRVRDRMSEGCNRLIRENRAAMIEKAEDLAYVMQWEAQTEGALSAGRQALLFADLSDAEHSIVEVLRQHETLDLDVLQHQSGAHRATLPALLLELECRGLIRHLPGNRYRLVR